MAYNHIVEQWIDGVQQILALCKTSELCLIIGLPNASAKSIGLFLLVSVDWLAVQRSHSCSLIGTECGWDGHVYHFYCALNSIGYMWTATFHTLLLYCNIFWGVLTRLSRTALSALSGLGKAQFKDFFILSERFRVVQKRQLHLGGIGILSCMFFQVNKILGWNNCCGFVKWKFSENFFFNWIHTGTCSTFFYNKYLICTTQNLRIGVVPKFILPQGLQIWIILIFWKP